MTANTITPHKDGISDFGNVAAAIRNIELAHSVGNAVSVSAASAPPSNS